MSGVLEEALVLNKALLAQMEEINQALKNGLPAKAAYSYQTAGELLDGVSVRTIGRLVDRGLLKRVPGIKTALVTRDSFWKFMTSGQAIESPVNPKKKGN